MKLYYARYGYIFCVGQNYHTVQLYRNFTKEEGLSDLISEHENSRASELLKELKSLVTKEQLEALKESHKTFDHHIVFDPSGNCIESRV